MAEDTDIRIAGSGQDWTHAASDLVRQVSERAIQAHGRFMLALSGGSTPKLLFQSWVNSDWRSRFDWHRILFFFGDDRCVPPEHPDSNFRMAQEALFGPLGIQPGSIYRMKGEAS